MSGELVLSPGPPAPDILETSGGASSALVSTSATGSAELDLAGGTAPTNLLASAGTLPGALQTGVIGIKGDKGDKGDPGTGGSGVSNVYIGAAPFPGFATETLVVELNPDGSPKTLWVGTNP